jgi:hypothetical protein
MTMKNLEILNRRAFVGQVDGFPQTSDFLDTKKIDFQFGQEAKKMMNSVLKWIISKPVMPCQSGDMKRYSGVPNLISVVSEDDWEKAVKNETAEADKLAIKNFSPILIQALNSLPQLSVSELSKSELPIFGITLTPNGNDNSTSILLKKPNTEESILYFLNALIEEIMHGASLQMNLLVSLKNGNPGMLELMTNYCRFIFLEENRPDLLLKEEDLLRTQLHEKFDQYSEKILNLQFRGVI